MIRCITPWGSWSLGIQHKQVQEGRALARAVGADKTRGNDFYLAGSKLSFNSIAGRNVMANLMLRQYRLLRELARAAVLCRQRRAVRVSGRVDGQGASAWVSMRLTSIGWWMHCRRPCWNNRSLPRRETAFSSVWPRCVAMSCAVSRPQPFAVPVNEL